MQAPGSLSPTNFLCREMQTAKQQSPGCFGSELPSSRGTRPAGRGPETVSELLGEGLAGSRRTLGVGRCVMVDRLLPSLIQPRVTPRLGAAPTG